MNQLQQQLQVEMAQAEKKAWEALGRYKFWMFGYYAAMWVNFNRLNGENTPNPWRGLVKFARSRSTEG